MTEIITAARREAEQAERNEVADEVRRLTAPPGRHWTAFHLGLSS